MADIFQKVFPKPTGHILSLDVCIGELVTAHLTENNEVKCEHDKEKQKDRINESLAEALEHIKNNLEMAELRNHQSVPTSQLAICFTQSRCDLKAIRFSAWIVGIVLAECYGIDFIWSSDSDTIIRPHTIPNITMAMARDARVGGASAVICVHNSRDSLVAKLATVMFALNTYLNRAAMGELEQSDCLMGPSAAFRVVASRQVMILGIVTESGHQNYHTRSETWTKTDDAYYLMYIVNEDVQMTVLLGKNGWRREYCQDSLVFTAVPTTARGLVGQKVRNLKTHKLNYLGLSYKLDALGESRHHGHLDRFFEIGFIISQSPLYLWHSLRISFYDRFVCIWIVYHTITGLKLYTVSFHEIVFLEILPPLYNYLRSPENLGSLPMVVILQLVNRLITPFFWTYALFTMFDDTWTVSAKVVLVKVFGQTFSLIIRKELLFFLLWIVTVFAAISRGTWINAIVNRN